MDRHTNTHKDKIQTPTHTNKTSLMYAAAWTSSGRPHRRRRLRADRTSLSLCRLSRPPAGRRTFLSLWHSTRRPGRTARSRTQRRRQSCSATCCNGGKCVRVKNTTDSRCMKTSQSRENTYRNVSLLYNQQLPLPEHVLPHTRQLRSIR